MAQVTVNAPSWWRGADRTRQIDYSPNVPDSLMGSDTGPRISVGDGTMDLNDWIRQQTADVANNEEGWRLAGYTGKQADGTVALAQNPWQVGGADNHYLTPQQEQYINQKYNADNLGLGANRFGSDGPFGIPMPLLMMGGAFLGAGALGGAFGGGAESLGLDPLTMGQTANSFSTSPSFAEMMGEGGGNNVFTNTASNGIAPQVGGVSIDGGNAANGLRLGQTGGQIGGGDLGSGLNSSVKFNTLGGDALGTGMGSNGVSGPLASGYFPSESTLSNMGYSPTTTGYGGFPAGAYQAAASAGGSALSRILGGNGSAADYGSILGGLGSAGLGYIGAQNQTQAYQQLANKYMDMGAPYRSRLEQLYSNPDSFLTSSAVQAPLLQAAKIRANALSTQGNPALSGNAENDINNFSANTLFSRLGEEKDRLGGFGGLSAYTSAAPQAQNAAITSNAGTYNAAGSALNNIFNPPKTAAQNAADFKLLMNSMQ